MKPKRIIIRAAVATLLLAVAVVLASLSLFPDVRPALADGHWVASKLRADWLYVLIYLFVMFACFAGLFAILGRYQNKPNGFPIARQP